MGTRPQTLGYGLADSPVAFAAFMYDYNGGEPQHSLTKDEVLDNVTLYWLTNTAVSSARIYERFGAKDSGYLTPIAAGIT